MDSAGAALDERSAVAAASAEVSELLLDRATAAASSWLRTKDAEPEPWRSAGDVITGTGHLTADQLAELIVRVTEAVVAALDRNDTTVDPPDARRVRVAFVAVPTE